jgi:hypothetical protein
MLTGRPPYAGKTVEDVLKQVTTSAPEPILVVNPTAHTGLALIAEGAMARELCDRYASMKYVLGDLERVAQGRMPNGPKGSLAPSPKPRRRYRVIAFRVVLGLVCAIAASLYVFRPWPLRVTNLEDEGKGSLRQAILNANKAEGQQVIIFSPALAGTIQLDRALPEITAEVEIRGPGSQALRIRRNAGEEYSILTIARTGNVQLSGLTLTDGLANNGGGICNLGSLTMKDCEIRHNRAILKGGGIYNTGNLEVDSCSLMENFSMVAGGGICCTDNATAMIRFTLMNGNNGSLDSGGNGGCINCGGSSAMTLRSCSILNSSAYNGGGMYVGDTKGFSGKLTIDSCTIANNKSTNCGGGILFDPSDAGTLLIRSSTISGNSVGGPEGGGLVICGDLHLSKGMVAVRISSSTITRNSSGVGAGVFSASKWAGFFLDNTIIAGNSCTGSEPDVHGAVVVSGSHNLIGIGTGMSGLRNGRNGNRIGTGDYPIDAKIDPLRKNGGPTLTHALQPDSPALDAGDNDAAPAMDQRGLPRVANGRVDIGAVELQPTALQAQR